LHFDLVTLVARLNPELSRTQAQPRVTDLHRASLLTLRGASSVQEREEFARAELELFDGNKGPSVMARVVRDTLTAWID
jgi:hypothetical protein